VAAAIRWSSASWHRLAARGSARDGGWQGVAMGWQWGGNGVAKCENEREGEGKRGRGGAGRGGAGKGIVSLKKCFGVRCCARSMTHFCPDVLVWLGRLLFLLLQEIAAWAGNFAALSPIMCGQ